MRPLFLEALIKDRTFMVRVTPEPLLEASVDDKNLMCLVNFSQDTNSKQDEISERPRAPCDGTNKNPLQCETCQQTFSQKANLTQHIRSHTGERPFQCETCQQTFTQKVHLTRHLRSHTGEHPFQCETCQQTFSQKANLTQHIRSHTGERPFQCETCQQTFKQKILLTQHIRNHTGEVEFVLDFTDKRTLSQQNDAAERMSIELVKWSKERVDAKKGALWYIGGGRNGRTSIDNVGMPETLSNSEIVAALRRDIALIRNLNGSKLGAAQIRVQLSFMLDLLTQTQKCVIKQRRLHKRCCYRHTGLRQRYGRLLRERSVQATK
jgi:uncharacterized Zn-finger protein